MNSFYLKKFAEANNYVLNKESLSYSKLMQNLRTYGALLCPCQHLTNDNAGAAEVCPCESIHDAVEISGKCYCGVFLRKED